VTTTLTDPVLEWDFAPFTEQVSLQAPDEVPAVDYSGITILGAQATDGKDYISTDGARFNGAGTPGVRRSIVYTPAADGVITVTFRSNNSSATDRLTAIGTAVVTGSDAAELLANEAVLAVNNTDGSNEVEVSAEAVADTVEPSSTAADDAVLEREGVAAAELVP
jgi:hypothetical protein